MSVNSDYDYTKDRLNIMTFAGVESPLHKTVSYL